MANWIRFLTATGTKLKKYSFWGCLTLSQGNKDKLYVHEEVFPRRKHATELSGGELHARDGRAKGMQISMSSGCISPISLRLSLDSHLLDIS